MRRPRWTHACAVLVFALLPLSGCETSSVTIQLSGFGQGSVDGIWFWKLSTQTGQYERSCRLAISNAHAGPQGETVSYMQDCVSGEPGVRMQASLVRSPTDPDTVTLQLWYFRFQDETGTYKASAYNTAGESALSPTTITL